MGTKIVPLSSAGVSADEDTGEMQLVLKAGDIDIGDVGVLDAAAARINPAKEDGNLAKVAAAVGGIDVQGATTVTGAVAETWLAAVAIPAHAGIDFELDLDAYVIFNTTEASPANVVGCPRYKPNLNFYKPAVGATWLHIAPVAANAVTMRWSYRAQT